MAQPQDPADRLPGDQLLLGAEEEAGAQEPRRGRSGSAQDLRAPRHSARGAEDPLGRGRRRGVRQRLGCDDVPHQARGDGHHLLFVLGSGEGPSRARAQVSRLGRAVHGQLLRVAQLRGFQRRLVRLRAEGRTLPDGALDVLPHQREEHRAVRAHADRGRRGRVCELPRGLHGADARREPAARGGGRARGARSLDDQVLDDPELVPRRRERQGRHLQLRDQARHRARRTRRSPGRRSRRAPRSHGSTRAASCKAIARSASSTRSRRRTTGSRRTPGRR